MSVWIVLAGLVWLACGYAGWRIVLYRFGRNCGAVDDAMIGPSMLIGPIALWIALTAEHPPS